MHHKCFPTVNLSPAVNVSHSSSTSRNRPICTPEHRFYAVCRAHLPFWSASRLQFFLQGRLFFPHQHNSNDLQPVHSSNLFLVFLARLTPDDNSCSALLRPAFPSAATTVRLSSLRVNILLSCKFVPSSFSHKKAPRTFSLI